MAKGAPPLRTLAAEFVGTFFLVTTWCSVSLSGDAFGALAVASTLMVCVYALGEVSGANFNPAVSLGLALAGMKGHGDMTIVRMLCYWVAQFLGAVVAAASSGAIHNTELGGPGAWTGNYNTTGMKQELLPYASQNALVPGESYDWASVVAAEAIYTALLVLVVLNVATCGDEQSSGGGPNNYFGLSIGFVIVAGAMAIGNVTQCSLNPAVSLGASVGNMIFGDDVPTKPLGWFVVYSLAEFLGACIGFLFFFIVRKYMLGKPEGGLHNPLPGSEAKPSKVSVLTAELLGTFYLVLTVCLVVQQQDAPTLGVLGIASSLMVVIFAMGKVSGGNYNPAVSLGLLLLRQMPVGTFVMYVVTQLLGGILAAVYSTAINGGWRMCYFGLNQHVNRQASWGSICGAEITYTFLLVFVVLNVAVKNTANQYYGLAIGFVIVAGGVSVGHLSGGMFNPAVTIGVDAGAGLSYLVKGAVPNNTGWFWAYAIFEFIGAAMAAGVVALMRPAVGAGEAEEDEESGSGDDSD